MKEKQSESGFTLAELLIVVAIIGVLVAISIPIFTSQLERSREATDAANIRAQYAQVMTEAIATGQNVNGKTLYGAIPLKQQNSGWNDENMGNNLQSIFGKTVWVPSKGGTAWVEYDAAGQMSILHFDGGTASDGNSGGTTGGDAEKQAGEPLPQIVRNGILQRKERTIQTIIRVKSNIYSRTHCTNIRTTTGPSTIF